MFDIGDWLCLTFWRKQGMVEGISMGNGDIGASFDIIIVGISKNISAIFHDTVLSDMS